MIELVAPIHVIGFIIFASVVKFGLKKSVTEKMIGLYVLVWLIGLLIFTLGGLSVLASFGYYFKYPAVLIGELIGLGLVFLIFDGIAWYVGKWIIKERVENKIKKATGANKK